MLDRFTHSGTGVSNVVSAKQYDHLTFSCLFVCLGVWMVAASLEFRMICALHERIPLNSSMRDRSVRSDLGGCNVVSSEIAIILVFMHSRLECHCGVCAGSLASIQRICAWTRCILLNKSVLD